MEYPVHVHHLGDTWAVTFPDVADVRASGSSQAQALEQARLALMAGLRACFDAGRPVPMPGPVPRGAATIELDPIMSGKVLLLNKMAEQKVRPSTLARQMPATKQEVYRLMSFDHKSKIDGIDRALRTLGHRLRLELLPASSSAPSAVSRGAAQFPFDARARVHA